MLKRFHQYMIVHYLLALLLFGIYGTQVCPFLESLSPLELLSPVAVTLTLALGINLNAVNSLRSSEDADTRKLWRLTSGLFAGGSLTIAGYFQILYGPPIESSLKVILGLSTIGFFIATDLALLNERHHALDLIRRQQSLKLQDRYIPLMKKFALFATANALFMASVIFLVINKDLDWLTSHQTEIDVGTARWSILAEIGFVSLVVLGYTLKVIHAYASNINFFLGNQTLTLQQAASGNLDIRTPVTSQDEFGEIANHTNRMIADLKQFNDELRQTRDVAILGLSSLAEARDNETGAHILRTQFYVKALAEHLKNKPEYKATLTDEVIELMHKSAPLHDIGKVGIPDSILLKPGKLTDEEFAIMKQHPSIGAKAIETAEKQLGSNSFLRFAHEIAKTHHEKWDGSGYPKGLKGEDIPLSGRLMALADVYDALISKRVYKPAFSHDKAKGIILEGKGNHFDPAVVDAFLAIEAKFVNIARTYSDHETQAAHETAEYEKAPVSAGA